MKIALDLSLKVEMGSSYAFSDIPLASPVPSRAAFGSDSRTRVFCPDLPLGECQFLPTIRDHLYKLRLDFIGRGVERRLSFLEALGEFIADHRVGHFLSICRINLSLPLIFYQRKHARVGFLREGSRTLDLLPRCVQNLDRLLGNA